MNFFNSKNKIIEAEPYIPEAEPYIPEAEPCIKFFKNTTDTNTNDTGILTIELKQLTDYFNIAIERKVFTKEEIIKIFPIWEKVSTFCDRIERKIKVENLYKS